MNQVVIAILGIFLAGFLYLSFSEHDEEAVELVQFEDTLTGSSIETVDDNSEVTTDFDTTYAEAELPEVDVVDNEEKIEAGDVLVGKYSADINNEKVSARLYYSFQKNGYFSHRRAIESPELLTLDVQGRYYREGESLTLNYNDDRDKAWIEKTAHFKIISSNEIKSGQLSLIKQ